MRQGFEKKIFQVMDSLGNLLVRESVLESTIYWINDKDTTERSPGTITQDNCPP